MVVIAFAVAPLLINVGLVITDFIYDKTGTTLTAYGLNNVEWLDFWKQYLAISISFLGVYLVYMLLTYLLAAEDFPKGLWMLALISLSVWIMTRLR